MRPARATHHPTPPPPPPPPPFSSSFSSIYVRENDDPEFRPCLAWKKEEEEEEEGTSNIEKVFFPSPFLSPLFYLRICFFFESEVADTGKRRLFQEREKLPRTPITPDSQIIRVSPGFFVFSWLGFCFDDG